MHLNPSEFHSDHFPFFMHPMGQMIPFVANNDAHLWLRFTTVSAALKTKWKRMMQSEEMEEKNEKKTALSERRREEKTHDRQAEEC